jgi:hypothetical protein
MTQIVHAFTNWQPVSPAGSAYIAQIAPPEQVAWLGTAASV